VLNALRPGMATIPNAISGTIGRWITFGRVPRYPAVLMNIARLIARRSLRAFNAATSRAPRLCFATVGMASTQSSNEMTAKVRAAT
jgi:hypothetical protein